MEKITILGAGSWGSALARILGDNKHNVVLYDTDQATIDEINLYHTNEKKLPGGILPHNVSATTSMVEALNDSTIVLISVPTKVIRPVLKEVNNHLSNKLLFVNASKGLEPDTFKRVSQIVEEEINKEYLEGFVCLTGPSHAEEVIEQLLTAITAASANIDHARRIQKIFSNQTYFRVYTQSDLIGAELGGSLKNIYAIASGMLHGLGLGDNAKAALITRALTEMRRLAIAMGAKEKTLSGLTGVGDLVVTATSHHSRNFQAGVQLATGKNLEDVVNNMSMVVEGARTCESAYFAAKHYKVDAPIIEAVYDVIYLHTPVNDAIKKIMARTLKDED